MTISVCSGEGNSDLSLEDVLLERFFLEPGMLGPIRSVHITDDDLMEIFGSSDIEGARTAFIKTLPHPILLTTILSGETSPCRQGSRPSFLRVLIFLSWMQTSSLRPKGLRNFREILDQFLDHKFYHMHGLNRMWEDLARFLACEYGIDLILPASMPHPHIGRTVRLAFPTWRDNEAMRRLRTKIEMKEQFVPLVVANRFKGASEFTSETSFAYNFDTWDQARLRNDQEAPNLPFWRAWTSIVSEGGGHDEIEAAEDEYGGVSLATVSPDGKSRPIRSLREVGRLRIGLEKDLRSGLVLMETLGFGRFRSTTSETRTLLVADSKMSGVDDSNAEHVRPLRGGWNLVTFKRRLDIAKPVGVAARSGTGWRGGIRVGSGYLGRVPLTPYFLSPGSKPAAITLNGENVSTSVQGGTIELEAGTYAGILTATLDGRANTVRVLHSAIEHPEHRRKALNEAVETSEDGALFGTCPTPASGQYGEWNGIRKKPTPEFEAIGEALYARSVRGLAVGEAIGIIGRGISRCQDAPSPWDVLKSYSDGGWLDMAVVRNFPARRVLQPRLQFQRFPSFPHGGAIVGPMVTASFDRISKCADAAGVTLHSFSGLSEWAPRYHRVQAESEAELEDFLRRADLSLTPSAGPARVREQWGDQVSLNHYEVEATWQPKSGFFETVSAASTGDGLHRMASSRETDPKLYAIYSAGVPVSTFRSPSLAVLAYSGSLGIPGATVDHGRLVRTGARIHIPASWARWVAARLCCNGGPIFLGQRWGYGYASSPAVISALKEILCLAGGAERDSSWDNFLASRSRLGRHMVQGNSQLSLVQGLQLQGNA